MDKNYNINIRLEKEIYNFLHDLPYYEKSWRIPPESISINVTVREQLIEDLYE